MKVSIKNIAKSLWMILAISIFPVIFSYSQNVKQANFSAFISPLLLFSGMGIIIYIICTILEKNENHGAIVALPWILICTNFAVIERLVQNLFPLIRYWHLLPICLIASFLLMHIILRHIPQDVIRLLIVAVAVALSFMLILNIMFAFPTVLQKAKTNKMETEQIESSQIANQGKNFYYFLFDEYASFSQLKDISDFSNQEMENWLIEHKFNISYNSVNESISTAVITGNLLALDYVIDENTTSTEIQFNNENAQLFKILKENGYQIKGLGDTGWLGIPDTEVKTDNTAHSVDGESVSQILFKNTVFYPFLSKSQDKNFEIIKNSLESMKRFPISPNTSTFTFGYLCAPHAPYYFKKDGSLNSTNDYFNHDGKHLNSYIGELEYVNTQIYEIIGRIIEQDPNAVVVICSDHGNRFVTQSTQKEMRIIFNNIYYGGEVLSNFEDKSSVNTMRYLLNLLLGTSLEEKEVSTNAA